MSIVDVIAVTTRSTDPRNYWKVLKNRLKKAQNKLVTQCNQLKMVASDGKSYLTDVADEDTILELVEFVSPEYLPSFKAWLATLERKSFFSFATPSTPPPEQYVSYPQSSVEDEDFMLMIDGYTEKDFIILQAFVAGVDVENLSIIITCDSVTIKGERATEKNLNRKNLEQEELYWGRFSRTIKLPKEIEINQTDVKEYHGLLTVKLPIIDKERSRMIKVKTI